MTDQLPHITLKCTVVVGLFTNHNERCHPLSSQACGPNLWQYNFAVSFNYACGEFYSYKV